MQVEGLYEGDEESQADANFNHAVEQMGTNLIRKSQLTDLAASIAHGFTQPEAADLLSDSVAVGNIISEIIHSMNRKGLIHNNNIDKFIATVKELVQL